MGDEIGKHLRGKRSDIFLRAVGKSGVIGAIVFLVTTYRNAAEKHMPRIWQPLPRFYGQISRRVTIYISISSTP